MGSVRVRSRLPRALSMGLYSEDEWKNSKGNESSLKFNEEETGDRLLVSKRALMARGRPGPAHKGADGLCLSALVCPVRSWPPHQLQHLRVTRGGQQRVQELPFRPGLTHRRRLENPVYFSAAPDKVKSEWPKAPCKACALLFRGCCTPCAWPDQAPAVRHLRHDPLCSADALQSRARSPSSAFTRVNSY